MTHRGGFSLSIIIWRIGGGGAKFTFALGQLPWGPKIPLAALTIIMISIQLVYSDPANT